MAYVYPELRRLAKRQLRGESDRGILDTTALVHEAYLRVADPAAVDWQNRSHFFAVAANAMRRIIIDYARRRCAQKRGGGRPDLTLDPTKIAVREQAENLLALNDSLQRLASFSERLARVVECRFFGGMTDEETAQALGASRRTVQRDWIRARAWLRKEMVDNDSPGAASESSSAGA